MADDARELRRERDELTRQLERVTEERDRLKRDLDRYKSTVRSTVEELKRKPEPQPGGWFSAGGRASVPHAHHPPGSAFHFA